MTTENAVLLGVGRDLETVSKSLDELKSLAETADCNVVCIVSQKRDEPHRAFYAGKGKVTELKTLIEQTNATILIADDELSPSQIKNLHNELDIKIIDRSVLILDIFANRASSSEGKIQVELAQQKYRLAHLSGIGVSLSRLGGGIGTRGPGEKKLETDKRHIRRAIKNLTAELLEIEKHRNIIRKKSKQSGIVTVSIVGYTNAGKSTLMNALTNAGVFAEDKLFATLDTTTRVLKLPRGECIRLSDTVGFINKLPHHLIKAFRSTLEELNYSDILLHVIDASGENYKEQINIVEDVINQIGGASTPVINVFNKIDLLNDDKAAAYGKKIRVSAKDGIGIESLLNEIERVIKSFKKSVRIIIPYSEGGLLSLIYGKCEIISESHNENGILIEAFADDEIMGRLKGYLCKTEI